jgi:hypothetical protein
LVFKEEVKRMSDNKYERTVRVYECQSCANCAFAADCKQKAGQHPCNRWAQLKTKRGITRTPLRFGKLVGRSTAKRGVIRGQ